MVCRICRKIILFLTLVLAVLIGAILGIGDRPLRGYGQSTHGIFTVGSLHYRFSFKLRQSGEINRPYCNDVSINLSKTRGTPNNTIVKITAIHTGNRLEGIDKTGAKWGPFKVDIDQDISPAFPPSLRSSLEWDNNGEALVYNHRMVISRIGRTYDWSNAITTMAWPAILGAFLGFTCWLILYFIIRGLFVLRRRVNPWSCPNCGYDQRGSTVSRRCPECGWTWPEGWDKDITHNLNL